MASEGKYHNHCSSLYLLNRCEGLARWGYNSQEPHLQHDHTATDLSRCKGTAGRSGTVQQGECGLVRWWMTWSWVWTVCWPSTQPCTGVKNTKNYNLISISQDNLWKKRGLTVMPMLWPHSVPPVYPFSVMVAVNARDGSVSISHGGTEMGQGLNTKVGVTVPSSPPPITSTTHMMNPTI